MKSVSRSKTVGVNIFGMLALLHPSSVDWIEKHPRPVVLSVLAANLALRFATRDAIKIEVPFMLKKFFPLAALAMILSSCQALPIDRAMGAEDGGDKSVVVIDGKKFDFIQVNEKTALSQDLTLTFPKTSCNHPSCVRYQFFLKTGSAGYGGSVPAGQSQAVLKLSDVVGHPGDAALDDDGEYRVLAQVYYLNQDVPTDTIQEYSTLGEGFVRLNVTAQAYRPVACGDPAIAWRSPVSKDCEAQFTSVFRSAVCGKGCK